jgi:hypothetical protein
MKKFLKIGLHILFWISVPTLIVYFVWATQNATPYLAFPKPETKSFIEVFSSKIYFVISTLCISIPLFYISYYLLAPRFLFKRKAIGYILYSVSIIIYYGLSILLILMFYRLFPVLIIAGSPFLFNVLAPIVIISTIGGTTFAFVEKSKKDRLDKEIFSRKNTQLELELLKSTISPHFLFNTLNNIDVLISKEPNKASEYLKKLSGILRFLFSNYKDEKIPLGKELKFIDQYVSLQKLRTTNSDFASVQISGEIDNWEIPPMLFLPFLENAFKYSTNKLISNAIEIKIDAQGASLNFLCKNKISANKNEIETHGVGIKLMKQRLGLIYKSNYKLDITDENDFFIINLIISR